MQFVELPNFLYIKQESAYIYLLHLRPSSCSMSKICPSSCAAIAPTSATEDLVSCVTPLENEVHMVPIGAMPIVWPSKSIPLQEYLEYTKLNAEQHLRHQHGTVITRVVSS